MKTYLPLFTGFYNTIWEMDDSYLIDEMDVDMENIDYARYRETYQESCAGYYLTTAT